MPSFEKPGFTHDFDVQSERAGLRKYERTKPGREIPKRTNANLLLASWNIANLGAQKREPEHYALLAEIISWFDLVAVQEVRNDLSGLRAVMENLSGAWRAVYTDKAGNEERMAFLYRHPKVKLTELCGELGIPVANHADIKLQGVGSSFTGFDRNPMITAFDIRGFRVGLVNVHLYFGKQKPAAVKKKSMERRQLEAYAVARWCDLRRKDVHSYVDYFIALGDFNLPKWNDANDPVRKALMKRGLRHPDHSTTIASAIASDSDYDQILCVPGLSSRVQEVGVFDYDGAVFPDLYQAKTEKQFNAYLRYYLSDHRPIWASIDIV